MSKTVNQSINSSINQHMRNTWPHLALLRSLRDVPRAAIICLKVPEASLGDIIAPPQSRYLNTQSSYPMRYNKFLPLLRRPIHTQLKTQYILHSHQSIYTRAMAQHGHSEVRLTPTRTRTYIAKCPIAGMLQCTTGSSRQLYHEGQIHRTLRRNEMLSVQPPSSIHTPRL